MKRAPTVLDGAALKLANERIWRNRLGLGNVLDDLDALETAWGKLDAHLTYTSTGALVVNDGGEPVWSNPTNPGI